MHKPLTHKVYNYLTSLHELKNYEVKLTSLNSEYYYGFFSFAEIKTLQKVRFPTRQVHWLFKLLNLKRAAYIAQNLIFQIDVQNLSKPQF